MFTRELLKVYIVSLVFSRGALANVAKLPLRNEPRQSSNGCCTECVSFIVVDPRLAYASLHPIFQC